MASTKVNNRGSPGSKRFRNDASRKDGDWTCPNCGNLNFSFRTVCNQGHCGAPRPSLTITPPAPIISPYRNSHPFYHGGFGIPPPSYGIPSQFGSPIPHPGLQYDYGLYARARAPYSPLPMFPPASFGGINYGPRPRIDGYGYGFQSPPPPWAEGLVADNFASRKRRGGPDGLSEGDWICPRCDNVNFAFRTTCNIKHCGAVKPSSNKPNTAVIPEGSWTCEKCGNLNYPFRNDLFEQWKETNKEDQKMFTEFINENVNLNKADESMLTTAIVAPPAAMMDKKAGQVVPQLALMNAIPDVVFVPSATLLALIAIKIIKLTFIGNTTSKDTKTHVQPTPEQKLPTTIAFEKEPQIATKQEPHTTTTIEEPQIATEQEPLNYNCTFTYTSIHPQGQHLLPLM
ncbi:hypothetical protein JHK82_026055 [Glycine max]|nr:hypothetical protein JHK85_026664 [Glycine max]KAG5134867.1 hypothetical protein JHK82_026055 [Glycine max]